MTLAERTKHSPSRGLLIAFEGIDGAGKTTQARMLEERLRNDGYDVVVFKEPTMGVWGRKIALLAANGRTASAEEEFTYFYEDRKEDVQNNILPALKKKQIVIMDRYYYSSMAYQGAKGLDPLYVEKKNLEIAPKPDIVILLDIDTKTATNRIKYNRNGSLNHFERQLSKVREVFHELAHTRPEVKTIGGTAQIEMVHSKIVSLVLPIILQYEE